MNKQCFDELVIIDYSGATQTRTFTSNDSDSFRISLCRLCQQWQFLAKLLMAWREGTLDCKLHSLGTFIGCYLVGLKTVSVLTIPPIVIICIMFKLILPGVVIYIFVAFF